MATDSMHQTLVTAFATRLAEITTTNGYNTDAGLNVHEWDVSPLDPNESTLRLDYRDEQVKTEMMAMGMEVHSLHMTVRILCKDNAAGAAMETVRSAVADVYQAIHDDLTFGGLAQDTVQVGNARFDRGEKSDTAAGCEVTYVIEYTTLPGTL